MRTTILLVLSVSTLVGASLANGTALDDDRPADAAKSAPPQYGVIPFSAEEAGKLQEAWATHLGTGKTVKNTLGMELVLIPPGKFRMELVDATLTRPFYLGKTEVTRVQWTAVMVETPRPDLKDPNRPMTDVSWYDAKTFCERLTAEEKNGTYRLPSEAEWEFACRAGTATRFSFGNDGSKLGEYAWISTNTRDSGEPYPHDVATKKPNPFGLFDMHGNVWELCDGHYTSDPSKEERPHLAQSGPMRVAAGGSWDSDFSRAYPGSGPEFYCRSAGRTWPVPSTRSDSTGFRVAWTPPEAPKKTGNSDRP